MQRSVVKCSAVQCSADSTVHYVVDSTALQGGISVDIMVTTSNIAQLLTTYVDITLNCITVHCYAVQLIVLKSTILYPY